MHKVKKNAIVFHPKEKMFRLVDLIENYPKFLPGVVRPKYLKEMIIKQLHL